jgi:hypothetical protein
LTGKPVSHEEKKAIAKVAVTVAATILAGHLAPLVGGLVHGELAGKVVEKIADQVGHHVIEHFAVRGLKLDGLLLPLVVRHDETHEHFAGEFDGMHDGGKDVKQSSSDKSAVYAGAVEAQAHQERFMGKVAGDLGAHTVDLGKSPGREREALAGALDKAGPAVVIGPLKSEKRADEKAIKENGGDWSKMGDMVRSSIAVDKVSDMKPMIDKLTARMKAEGITLARAPNDRFAKPIDGYRDVLLNVKYPNGHIGEIQLHTKPMLRAKVIGEGHKLYEESRTILGNAEHEHRELTAGEKATVASNSEKSRAVYEPAHKAAGGN